MEVLMAKDTKERILAAALEQFSQNGYAGTNIRELTASLGLVKSAMYKHFESKEDIWNTLLDEMIVYYDEHFGSSDHLPPVPDNTVIVHGHTHIPQITHLEDGIVIFNPGSISLPKNNHPQTFGVCEDGVLSVRLLEDAGVYIADKN
jgi:hypothetical protein